MTIVIVIGVVLVVGYFFLSANGVKLFKKEHKVKAKKSNEEKFEEVLPKEKKEKKEKKPVVKISDVAKKEKLKEDIKKELDAKTSAPASGKKEGGGTVTKITKEDFVKNNIEVPSTSNLLTDEEKKAMTVKSLPKAKEQPSKPYDFGLPDFDSAPVKNLAGDDLALPKDDPFADIDFDAILNGTSSGKDDPFGRLDAFDFPGVGSEGAGSKPKYAQKGSDEYFNLSPAFDMSAQSKFDGDPVVVSSLGERFEQVFGSNFEAMGGSEMGKEILIGDILSGPRARENRIRRTEREKRQRWM